MEGETLTVPRHGLPEEAGRKGGRGPTFEERWATKVASVLAQMSTATDDSMRVTLYFLLVEHQTREEGGPVGLLQIAEGSGLSKGRARTALLILQGLEPAWVEPVGRTAWRFLPITAER